MRYPVGPTTIQDPQQSRLVQIVVLVVQIATTQRPTPSLLRRQSIFAPGLLLRARAQITSNTTPVLPSATLNRPREQGTPRRGSASAVITKISPIRRMSLTALCERGVKPDVESCVHVCSFHFYAYTIAYGHASLQPEIMFYLTQRAAMLASV